MDVEDMGGGRQVVRDIDGKIMHSRLDPETARQMGKNSHSRDAGGRVDALLMAKGLDPATADEGLRTLALIGVSGRSGAVSALRYLDALTGYGRPDVEAENPVRSFADGELIEVNGDLFWKLDADRAAKLMDLLAERRSRPSETQQYNDNTEVV